MIKYIFRRNLKNNYFKLWILIICSILVLTFLNLGTISQTGGNQGANNYPPILSNGSVTPSVGWYGKTLFTYQVTYQDLNNDTPVIKDVYINYVPHSMNYVSGNYTTGAIFEYKTYLYTWGYGSYYFYFTDGWTNGSARLPATGNLGGPLKKYPAGGLYPPSLSGGNVTPQNGTPSTLFTYQVTFKDLDNVAPIEHNVTIDGTRYLMNRVSGAYNQGALYRYQTTLAAGNHTYYFKFTDGNNTARLPPNGTYYGPIVSYPGNGTQNTPPTLSNGFVNPNYGTPNTIFTYQVTYKDIDNDPPVIRNVVIDNKSYQMNYSGGAYYQGAIYQYKTPLSLGNHTYYFYFTDGNNGAGRLPAQGSYSGPFVNTSSQTNNPPYLYNGTVTPTSGTTNTLFTYQVTYSDADNDPPTLKYVYIDGLPFVMNFVYGSFNTGAIYQYKTQLSVGLHNYSFQFSDGKSTSHLPTQGGYSGPTVSVGPPPNNPPILTNGTVAPQAGNISTVFTYKVIYKDIDGDPPTIYNIYINSMAYQMIKISGNYTSGALYQYTTTLPAGNHTYSFFFYDGKAIVKLPAYGSYSGPVVSAPNGSNNAPTLYYGFVSPQSGNTNTTFTYQVYYKDIDNDPPVIKSVFIDNNGFVMTKISGNYTSGALYQYKTTLPVGNHTYSFFFNDGKASVKLPTYGSYSGPVVSAPNGSNNAPTLFYGLVSPQSGTPTTIFTYQVYYKDIDNDPPVIKSVFIDNNGFPMTKVTGNYNTGALYQYTTKLAAGNHNYYFYFSDGVATARLPANGTYPGPTVTAPPTNNAPFIFYGTVSPSSGTTLTIFTYQVYYKDLDNDAPTIKDVYIDGTPNAMTMVTGAYNTGALFQFKTTLGVGYHNYYFYFSDGKATTRLPSIGTYSGPVVILPNKPPVADAGVDQTVTVGPPHIVYFDGSGSYDANNDTLIYFWDFMDGNYAFGINVSHTFHGVGTYNVSLTVWDGQYSDRDYCLVKVIDSGKGKTKGKTPDKSLPDFEGLATILAFGAVALIIYIKRHKY